MSSGCVIEKVLERSWNVLCCSKNTNICLNTLKNASVLGRAADAYVLSLRTQTQQWLHLRVIFIVALEIKHWSSETVAPVAALFAERVTH